MEYIIDEMNTSDWEQVNRIYIEGIQTGIATFQNEAPTWDNWDEGHIKAGRLVARSGPNILGWAALGPTSSRDCYAGVVEVSVYIGEKYKGQGIGAALLNRLITVSEENGFWTLYSAIIKDNHPSIALHKKCGFRKIGLREKVAQTSDGLWRDAVIMERRSKVVGI